MSETVVAGGVYAYTFTAQGPTGSYTSVLSDPSAVFGGVTTTPTLSDTTVYFPIPLDAVSGPLTLSCTLTSNVLGVSVPSHPSATVSLVVVQPVNPVAPQDARAYVFGAPTTVIEAPGSGYAAGSAQYVYAPATGYNEADGSVVALTGVTVEAAFTDGSEPQAADWLPASIISRGGYFLKAAPPTGLAPPAVLVFARTDGQVYNLGFLTVKP